MDILYLLIPLSVVLAFLVLGVFAWALKAGQFEDLEREGERIFEEQLQRDATQLDQDQVPAVPQPKQ
ncbi:MAG: cbb3-type cytochrome oxidase assembly protein CcoS [Burkholderiales bacterium]